MKLSEQKKEALYQAFSRPIRETRVDVRIGSFSAGQLDHLLMQAELRIWRRICEALNLTDELPEAPHE